MDSRFGLFASWARLVGLIPLLGAVALVHPAIAGQAGGTAASIIGHVTDEAVECCRV